MMSDEARRQAVKAPLLLLAVAILAVAVWGCASGRYGGLERDAEVTRMFVTNSVPANYSYFLDGPTQMPYAIIGIKPDVHYNQGFWTPVTPNTQDFADKVKFIFIPSDWDKLDPAQGAWMLDPEGRRIGIWYSMYPWTTIKEKEGTIFVFSPFIPNGWD